VSPTLVTPLRTKSSTEAQEHFGFFKTQSLFVAFDVVVPLQGRVDHYSTHKSLYDDRRSTALDVIIFWQFAHRLTQYQLPAVKTTNVNYLNHQCKCYFIDLFWSWCPRSAAERHIALTGQWRSVLSKSPACCTAPRRAASAATAVNSDALLMRYGQAPAVSSWRPLRHLPTIIAPGYVNITVLTSSGMIDCHVFPSAHSSRFGCARACRNWLWRAASLFLMPLISKTIEARLETDSGVDNYTVTYQTALFSIHDPGLVHTLCNITRRGKRGLSICYICYTKTGHGLRYS